VFWLWTAEEISRLCTQFIDQPSASSENQSCLGVTHHPLASHCSESRPTLVKSQSFATENLLPSQLEPPNFLRSPFCQQSTETLLHFADGTHETRDVITKAPSLSASIYLRFSDDVIGSRDLDSVSENVSKSSPGYHSNFDEISNPNPQSDKVLDLSIKSADENHVQLQVLSTDVAKRQKKSRVLDMAVQKLWLSKLQQQKSACAADDVIFRDLETSRSRERSRSFNCDDLVENSGSPSRRSDEEAGVASRSVEERPSLETTKVTESRSRSPGQGHGGVAELTLRRVVATPGDQTMYFTSLMRLHATTRCKQHPTHVSSLTYLLT